MKKKLISKMGAAAVVAFCLPVVCWAQVNSGSNGSDGAFNPTSSTNIDMSSRPSGIYQYTSVNIPWGVTVSFTPNANNTPVVWLVQSNCVIGLGACVSVAGGGASNLVPGPGGPGGFRGGNGGLTPGAGQGPGGGLPGPAWGAGGSYATLGRTNGSALPGPIYGNVFLVPLLGGSGQGGGVNAPGGGGGGAILIAASGTITVNGSIYAFGGAGQSGGRGSGGAIRLVALRIAGGGYVDASDGGGSSIGLGPVRFDTYDNSFSGATFGVFSQGFQSVIVPTPGVGAQMTISSIGGVAVSASPSGVLTIPDAVISAQQANPIPVVVSCANIPLGTAVTVTVRSATGSIVTAVGSNTTGTQSSSTATVLINIPRGGGIIYATAATSS